MDFKNQEGSCCFKEFEEDNSLPVPASCVLALT